MDKNTINKESIEPSLQQCKSAEERADMENATEFTVRGLGEDEENCENYSLTNLNKNDNQETNIKNNNTKEDVGRIEKQNKSICIYQGTGEDKTINRYNYQWMGNKRSDENENEHPMLTIMTQEKQHNKDKKKRKYLKKHWKNERKANQIFKKHIIPKDWYDDQHEL